MGPVPWCVLTVVARASLLAVVVACSSGKSSGGSGGGGDPLVNQAKTGAVQPFAPRDQKSATAAYAPGADSTVSVYTSRITMPNGALATEASLALQLIPSTITQTPSLVVVSPLMQFGARDPEDEFVGRTALKRSLKAEVIVDRFVSEEETVVLMILHYGTAEEERYMIVPDDLTFVIQDDNSRLITFETRDTDFAFAIAAAKGGTPTNGYAEYPAVPPESGAISITSEDTADQPTELIMTWVPGEGSRTGYLLKYAYEAFTSSGCEDGVEIPAAEITEVREKFPKVYTDSFTLSGLDEGATVYLQLCSTNSRSPADVSPGVNASFALPSRSLATLSGTPDAVDNATALNVTVGGQAIAEYQYALLGDVDDCTGASYSAWTPVATRITDAIVAGEHRLCVLGRKTPTNLQVEPTTFAWTADMTVPGNFTIDAVATPTNDTTPTLTWQTSTDAVNYTVKIATDSGCVTVVKTLVAAATTVTSSALSSNTYYICATATDVAGNTVDATNDGVISFVLDTTAPVFTSLVAAGVAADGYVNAADAGNGGPLATLTASGQTTTEFSDPLDDTPAVTCNVGKTYGNATVPVVSDLPATDDDYVVCVKLSDAAGNVTYGKSSVVTRDVGAPSAFSITAPTGASTTNDNSVTVTWSDPGDADEYDVAIDDSSGCGSPEQVFGGVATTSQDVTLDDGTWFVCVLARDGAGNETAATNDDLTFTVASGTWETVTGTGAPSARSGATAVWDTVGSKAIFWGGHDGGDAVQSGGAYDPSGDAWTATDEGDGDLPAKRVGHSAVWDGTRMIVWGGHNDDDGYLDSGALYTPGGPDDWAAMNGTGAPAPRRGHVAVWTGSEMIVWGGEDGSGVRGDGGEYTPPGGDAWSAVQTTGAPTARRGATAVWTGTRMIVWGGFDGTARVNDGGVYDPAAAGTWTAVQSTGAPTAREGHTAVWTGTLMLVWGGYDGTTYLASGGIYDPSDDDWLPMATADAPIARRDHVAVWDTVGARMVLFGGYDGSPLGDGAGFDPGGNAWTIPSLNASGSPTPRRAPAAVWSGTKLVFFGGSDGSPLGDGARFTPP